MSIICNVLTIVNSLELELIMYHVFMIFKMQLNANMKIKAKQNQGAHLENGFKATRNTLRI